MQLLKHNCMSKLLYYTRPKGKKKDTKIKQYIPTNKEPNIFLFH